MDAVILAALLITQADAFSRWESLDQSFAASPDRMAAVFSAWDSAGADAAFARWDELCRHKCADGCECGDGCTCSEKCECINSKKVAKPAAKLSPEAQKKVDEQRAKPKADLSELKPSYPTRDARTWWTHPGDRTKPNIIAHLMSGQHAGKFNRETLEKMTLAELESLHSDDHEHRTKAIAMAPKPAATAPKKTVPIYENRKVCNGGFCTITRFIVGYRYE